MSRITLLKKQHQNIKELFKSIEYLLNNKDLSQIENAKEIRQRLSLLAGKLRIHMNREDEFLYPQLLKSDNVHAKKVVRNFVDEMGNLASDFKEFSTKYLRYSIISEKEQEFKQELLGILKVLKERIAKEDKDLYPLTDLLK